MVEQLDPRRAVVEHRGGPQVQQRRAQLGRRRGGEQLEHVGEDADAERLPHLIERRGLWVGPSSRLCEQRLPHRKGAEGDVAAEQEQRGVAVRRREQHLQQDGQLLRRRRIRRAAREPDLIRQLERGDSKHSSKPAAPRESETSKAVSCSVKKEEGGT